MGAGWMTLTLGAEGVKDKALRDLSCEARGSHGEGLLDGGLAEEGRRWIGADGEVEGFQRGFGDSTLGLSFHMAVGGWRGQTGTRWVNKGIRREQRSVEEV